MPNNNTFDVIVIGGSYAGLAAGMALGRSLRKVLIIDSGKPCNRQTPHSHNFLTQDGVAPKEIASIGKKQVEKYESVTFINGVASKGVKTETGFDIYTETGKVFKSSKLIFATGVKDLLSDIPGYSECWGISAIHCPYCHGYEVKNKKTGILGNGEYGMEFSTLISNWTKDLTLYTNGKSMLTEEQTSKLKSHDINVVEKEIKKLEHKDGYLHDMIFTDGTKVPVEALYSRNPFVQHCTIPEALGCELTEEGYIKTDFMQKTTVEGIYACGDSVSRMRTVSNAVATGATAAMVLNREFIFERF